MVRVMQLDRGRAVADRGPIFVGDVLRQNLVANGDADLLRVTSVTFVNGARNHWHRHTTDQVLVCTEGSGIVATDVQEWRLGPGSIVLVPANERHWHGATDGADFTHLSVLTPGEMIIDVAR